MNAADSRECSLSDRNCVPCRGGVPPLNGAVLQRLMSQLQGGWTLVEEHHLEKEFVFKDFKTALEFTNRVGTLAETENHHPDIALSWGRVKITLWTHKIDGLAENDFILAAKIDGQYAQGS